MVYDFDKLNFRKIKLTNSLKYPIVLFDGPTEEEWQEIYEKILKMAIKIRDEELEKWKK